MSANVSFLPGVCAGLADHHLADDPTSCSIVLHLVDIQKRSFQKAKSGGNRFVETKQIDSDT